MHITVQVDPVFVRVIPFLQAIKDRPPVIVEIGVHVADSTTIMRLGCRVPPIWYGFEPDPRNYAVLQNMGIDAWPLAASDERGEVTMYLSGGQNAQGQYHTASSSLRAPTRHLEAHPWVTFSEQATVQAMPLDAVIPVDQNVDLIWCDVQGAQRQVLAGARGVLERTRWLYIEVHPVPLYDGEPTYEELLEMLPGWRVVERYEADVLLERCSDAAEPVVINLAG